MWPFGHLQRSKPGSLFNQNPAKGASALFTVPKQVACHEAMRDAFPKSRSQSDLANEHQGYAQFLIYFLVLAVYS